MQMFLPAAHASWLCSGWETASAITDAGCVRTRGIVSRGEPPYMFESALAWPLAPQLQAVLRATLLVQPPPLQTPHGHLIYFSEVSNTLMHRYTFLWCQVSTYVS